LKNVWEGSISDVRVYNRILTSNEISGLFDNYSDKYDRYLKVKDPGQGLMGYWNFNEGEGCMANDNSGNNNHGKLSPNCDAISPAFVEDRYKKPGRALEFDGMNDFVIVPDSASLQAENEITVSAWVKVPDPLPGTNQTILYKRASGSDDFSFVLLYDKDSKGFGWAVSQGRPGTLDYIKSINTALPGKWQHITAVFDGAVRSLYVGNNRINDVIFSTLEDSGTDSDFYIGQKAGGSDKYQGLIDDVRIYGNALSDNEITSLYLGDVNYYTLPVLKK